jgi:hypothetical protein
MKPMMTEEEVSAVETLLLEVAARNNGKLDVLEWGSGGSTVHFPAFLLEHDVETSWLSLEYSRVWHDRVSDAISADERLVNAVTVWLFDLGNTRPQRDTPMDEYIAYPRTLGRTWDFILVDGRKRRRCLIEAAQLVTPSGCVVLHDAQRRRYHCAFEHFAKGEFIGQRLWVGRA